MKQEMVYNKIMLIVPLSLLSELQELRQSTVGLARFAVSKNRLDLGNLGDDKLPISFTAVSGQGNRRADMVSDIKTMEVTETDFNPDGRLVLDVHIKNLCLVKVV